MSSEQIEIFVLQPSRIEFEAVYETIIHPAASASGAKLFRANQIEGGAIIEGIYEAIERANLIICDITGSNPNVMYELGFAHALEKPVIIISQEPQHLPFDIKSTRILYYEISSTRILDIVRELKNLILKALETPSDFSARPFTQKDENNVFISYSHHDTEFLERLLVHLKPLERRGIIDLWVDTKLNAGDRWKEEVKRALKQARVAILLISADFLASDFIVNNELPPLLEKAESEGTRIIPVILRPCRFVRDENLKHFQAINDPAFPVGNLPENKRELIYDKISKEVEMLIVK